MKKVKLFESFISEANRGKVHKAAKQGSYPAVIVVVLDGKVIHQEPVSTPEVAPATFNVMQEKYPKALLHLEDKTGKRLFSESVVNEDSAGRMELLKTGKYKDTRGKKHTLKAGQIGRHERIGWDGDFIHFGNLVFDANAFGNDDIEVYESLVNEKREDVGKYNTVKKVISKLGRRPSEKDLAKFINDNYYDVTEVERGDDDSKADDKIADLVGVYKFDIDDWEKAWNSVQNESVVSEGKMPNKLTNDDDIVFLKASENSKGAHYNVYYKGYDIDFGGVRFGTEEQLKSYAKEYILSRQWANKLRWEDAKPLPESVVTEQVKYSSSNTKEEAAKQATKEFGNLLPKVNKGVEPYEFAVVKTKARNYRLAIKSGSYIAHEFMSGLKGEGILTTDDVKKAVANVIKMNPDEFNEAVVDTCWDGYKLGDPKTKISSKTGKRVNNCVPANESVVNEAAYENSTQNELAEYIMSLSNELKYAKANNDKKEIKFLEGDIAEVKAALAKMKNESVVTESLDRMIKQIERALEDGTSIFKLPMATQKYYNKNKSDFETVSEGIFDSIADPIKALHFETDPKTAELMKIELGKKQGETNKKKQIDSAEYSLKRFRKSIKFGDGTYLGVFLPGSYDASVSTLGDGPHKKAVAKVKWSQKKYDQWLEDMAANGGADNAFDMAQNAKNETGLIDWVKKEFRGEDPLQRIQWDIEAFAESVVTEGIKKGATVSYQAFHASNHPSGSYRYEVKANVLSVSGKEAKITYKDQDGKTKTIEVEIEKLTEAFAESVTNEEIKSYNEKDTLYKQIHDKYAESIKGLKAGKIKKLTDLVSVQRWAMEDEHDTPGHDHKKMSATFKEERKLFKQWMAGDKDVQLKEAVELVESFKKFKDHIASINDGSGSTAEVYFTKGKGYYVVVSGEYDYDFDAKDKKELTKKLKDNEFTNEPFEGSI